MENLNTITMLSILIIIIAVIVIFFSIIRTIKTYSTLNQLLDSAIDDTFSEKIFDETRFSALENKLARYLAGSQTSALKVTEERNKIKTLISDISHQTKTPISNILLYGELLCERDMDEESRRCVYAINEQTQKLSFLIETLVKLSRLETGIIAVKPQKGNVSALAQNIYNQYKPKAIQKELEFIYEDNNPDNSSFTAVFDEKWTLEALGNIADNAIKYTDSGSVTLRVKAYEMFCCIEISDTGIGISEYEHAQIFSRFYRGKNTKKKDGIGIGLYLARQIAEAEGGYIKVISPNREKTGAVGTTFQFYLPRE